ncbi:hypothetical protein O181_007505 [Austropuccinia psidii MF-1]|uniref:Uncharacterized protein n=1 Tax=Austropuccinia psidii MF-1 TaxID=1389203 RepID=A0A9Q3BN31_9BASI|nr:hypothetical protein [Austropuccinia psidii MF-1]
MAVQNSPPANNIISQKIQAVLTPTARAPLDCTPSVHQLGAKLDRGPPMEGEEPSRRGGMKSRSSRSFSSFLSGYPGISQVSRSRLGQAADEEGEESEETIVTVAFASAPEASETPNISLSNKPLVSQAEPNVWKVVKQMTQFMGKLTQAVTPRDNPRAP